MNTEPRHVYRCTFGSRLYGTELPDSDFDTKGVFLPTADQILLCQPPKTWTAPTVEGQDNESYSLQRYLELLAQGQTVALDMLFAPGDCWKVMDPIWFDVLRAAPSITSKNCKAAIGYARTQAQKYSLRGARISALEAVLKVLWLHPTKRDPVQDALFSSGYHLSQLPDEVKSYINTAASATDDVGLKFLEVCGKKVGYTSSVQTAINIFKNALDDYGHRSRQAQEGGADWKALYHAVRITEQTIELLQTGAIVFPRWNAPDLLKIRRGEYAPEVVYERIEAGIIAIENAQAESDLPDAPDYDLINKLVRDIHLEIVNGT